MRIDLKGNFQVDLNTIINLNKTDVLLKSTLKAVSPLSHNVFCKQQEKYLNKQPGPLCHLQFVR
jgi:hypothetical protein